MYGKVHEHTWVGSAGDNLQCCSSALCFESGSLFGLGLADSVRLTGQDPQRSQRSHECSPHDQNYKYMPQRLGSGNWTLVQVLVWQTLDVPSYLYSLIVHISYKIELNPSLVVPRMGATLAEESFAQENWVSLPLVEHETFNLRVVFSPMLGAIWCTILISLNNKNWVRYWGKSWKISKIKDQPLSPFTSPTSQIDEGLSTCLCLALSLPLSAQLYHFLSVCIDLRTSMVN